MMESEMREKLQRNEREREVRRKDAVAFSLPLPGVYSLQQNKTK